MPHVTDWWCICVCHTSQVWLTSTTVSGQTASKSVVCALLVGQQLSQAPYMGVQDRDTAVWSKGMCLMCVNSTVYQIVLQYCRFLANSWFVLLLHGTRFFEW